MWHKQRVVIHGHVTATPVKNYGMPSYFYSNEKVWYTEGYSSEKVWYKVGYSGEKVCYVDLLLVQ
jgi:hypothetical protein